jgi:serine protease Do
MMNFSAFRRTFLLSLGVAGSSFLMNSLMGYLPGKLGTSSQPHSIAANTPVATPTPGCISDQLPDMVERVSPGVVNISSTTISHYRVYGMDDFFRGWGIPQERKQTSLGSGFIIDNDGFILTNHHVVHQASEVMVTLLDKRQFRARIVGKDDKMDLALLQIRDTDGKVPSDLKPVSLGDSDSVRIAEAVVAVGNPFGLQNTVTRGIISAKNRTIGLGPYDNFLQTDAAINPGNSGGPLFNAKGEVIGINTAIRSETGQSSGLAFATLVNEAIRLLPDLKKYGRVPRPWLGILAERMTPQLAQHYRLATPKGVLIYNTVESGPADRSGLQQGDIITGIDGQEMDEPNDVERILAKHKPQDQVTVKFYRGSKTRELSLKLDELPRLENLPRGII